MRSCSVGGSAVALCVALMVAVSSRPVAATTIATRCRNAQSPYSSKENRNSYQHCGLTSDLPRHQPLLTQDVYNQLKTTLGIDIGGYRYQANSGCTVCTMPRIEMTKCSQATERADLIQGPPMTWMMTSDAISTVHQTVYKVLWTGIVKPFMTSSTTKLSNGDSYTEPADRHFRCILSQPNDFQEFRDYMSELTQQPSAPLSETGTPIEWRIDRHLVPCTTTFTTKLNGFLDGDYNTYRTDGAQTAIDQCKRVIAECGENSNWVCDHNPTVYRNLSPRDLILVCCSPSSSNRTNIEHEMNPETHGTAAHSIKTLCGYTDTESVLTHAPFKGDLDRALNRPTTCGAGVATSVPKRMECCTGGTQWTQDTTNIKDLCYKSVAKPTGPPATWKCGDISPTDTYWAPWLNNDPSNGGVEKTAKAEECCNYDKPYKGLGGGNCASFSI